MPATPLDSALYRDLLGDREIGALFTDSAEVRAMLVVEGALAKTQGQLGVIPEVSAEAIHRASLEVQIDLAALAEGTGRNAVPVPSLVSAFRTELGAPEHAQYVHWGATSQDIMDTALSLRLRQVLVLLDARMAAAIRALGALADAHAELPMAGRTYGQAAVPTSFGAVASVWGRALLEQRAELPAIRDRVLIVSLSGAAGTLSAMGKQGPAVRAALSEALNLGDPGSTWHGDRGGISALSGWLTGLCTALGKMGEDLILLTQSGIGEVTLGQTGASSTMPQKANPVLPSLLVAIARMSVALNSAVQGAALHRQERDGAAWMTEWLSLPQICLLAARALGVAEDLTGTIAPDGDAMHRNLEAGGGAIFAEALTFALTAKMSRPDAQEAVKALVAKARAEGAELSTLARVAHPDLPQDLFDPHFALGMAPDDARVFAQEAATA